MSENEIWRLAEIKSICMHQKLTQNEELNSSMSSSNNEIDFAIDIINSNFDFANNTFDNFFLSNIGIMNNTKNYNVITLKEHYVAVSCLENRCGPVFEFGVTTIENNLNIAISFNEKIFSTEFIKNLKKDFLENIETLIK